MLDRIIKYSLNSRLVIVAIAVLILTAGTIVTIKMEIDVFPDLTAPTVVVMTEAHGMAPEEVERLVSFPIETAINGATNIRRVRSSSAMGFSIVWAEFDWNTDIFNARQTITERLIQVSENLPHGVSKPMIAPQSSLMGEVMILGLTSSNMDPMELRTFADWNIRPRLLSIAGVSQVVVIGGEYKEYQILANPDKMRYYQVSLDELIEAANNANENASGGFINEYGNEYTVLGIARTANTEDIGKIMVKMVNHKPIMIRDIAEVKIGSAPKIGDSSVDAEPAVLLTIVKQPKINTILLVEEIDDALEEITKSVPGITYHTQILNQAEFITTSINNVKKAMLEGSVFVVLILFLFLMNSRTTFISLLAMPLSILISLMTLRALGITINTMTLGGIAIAIGSLVDDAIIDVENVYKRLKANYWKPPDQKQKSLTIVFEASREIRSSILNATLIIIVAFIPLFFLSGMEGRMLKPLGIAYIVSLFASLIVAITITPVLCSLLLTNDKNLKRQREGSWVERNLKKIYFSSLQKALQVKFRIIGIALTLFISAVVIFFTFGRDFLPPFNEGSMTINVITVPGISLEESNKIGLKAEQLILSIPEVQKVGRKTGRGELSEHTFGVNVSELDVPFTLTNRTKDEFLAEVRQKLGTIPGVGIEVGAPITHRINHMLSGSQAGIAIKIFGADLSLMYKIGTKIKDEILHIEGIGDLTIESQVEVPQIRIIPKREILAKYGISLNHLQEFITNAFGGVKVSDVFEDEKAFDLVVRFRDKNRDNIGAIREALIDTHDGKKIPLSFVADVKSSSGPNTISRENVQRKLVVSVNSAGRDLGSLIADIREAIDNSIELPENYRIEYGGQFKSTANATRVLTITSIMAIFIIFIILFQEFKDSKIAGVILINLPLSLIGGVAAILLSTRVVSIPGIIGFITLFGIATRNGILLISRYQHLLEQGKSLEETILKGSIDRLSPILMTALTAALSLLPLAISGNKSGNEIQSPMAIVILGGLLSSTLLNIYIIPIVYSLIKTNKQKNENE